MAGTLLGVVVTHLLEQRGRAYQKREDIAFGPLQDRYEALKATYRVMVPVTSQFFKEPSPTRRVGKNSRETSSSQ